MSVRTSVLGCGGPDPSEGCGASDSEWRTLSSESMEDAELTEMPDAEVTEERDEWTNDRT